jgi:transmembrane sensor
MEERAIVIERAAEWYVANREPMSAEDTARFASWLRESPLHIDEYLGVAIADQDLRRVCASEESLEAYLASSRAAEQPDRLEVPRAPQGIRSRRLHSHGWRIAAAVALSALIFAGMRIPWHHPPPRTAVTQAPTVHLRTARGEQRTETLADHSVLVLNTDSAVDIRYDRTARLVSLLRGEALFQVAHDPGRPFRVVSGPAETVAVGTQFAVRLDGDAAWVTVLEGRVRVGSSSSGGPNAASGQSPGSITVGANQQVRVAPGQVPAEPSPVDAQRVASWLQHQIVFEHAPLEQVALELNRYMSVPIVIESPELLKLQISGVLRVDDPDGLVEFLRTLKGVQVDVTKTAIQVRKK